ncbi:TetR/AcrR family transcriptional regulator [Fundidesulfovibrio agrisoli]|uniref:TetR/AcrR family transcriptional regulator n=1 Tax=Fundidesulfovibrio agrisoli TaxID=2922717 RepID=UPI001FAE6504|nr:TetR/AcrR family transcriptional regulator [Fundidesulfovibrio agrisoli]
MKRDTRQEIIEAAARLIHMQGYTATGIKEIVEAAKVPKGSFYFYFPSKEALGLALVEHYCEIVRSGWEPVLADASTPPLERLRRLFLARIQSREEAGYALGCPIGGLAQEMSALSGPLRERLRQALDGLTAMVRSLLEEAAQSGLLPQGMDPATAAAFIVDAWEGALLRMKADAGPEALDRFMSVVFDRLLV